MDHRETEDRVRRLVERAQGGDRQAWDELIAAHGERLKAAALGLLGESGGGIAVEDVLQETFLRALRSVHGFEWQGEGSFLRWLVGIASNVAREMAKERRRRPLIRLWGLAYRDDASQGRLLRRDERFDRLEQAVSALSPEHREVVRLARLEGLPLKEVARRMGRTHGAVRQLLWRALRNLKERFGDTESLGLPPRGFGEQRGPHAE